MAYVQIGRLVAYDHERIATLTSSTGLTTAKLQDDAASGRTKNAEQVQISVEVASIRYTVDGTTPTVGASGNGHVAEVGDIITITTWENIKAFRAINYTGSSGAELRVTYYR